MKEDYPENTLIGSLMKARIAFGMMLMRAGAEIVMKNSNSYKIYIKHNEKLETIGELIKYAEQGK